MHRYLGVVGTSACVLAAFLAVPAVGQDVPHVEPLPPPKGDAVGVSYWGEVVKLTKTTITIQFPNPTVTPREFFLSNVLVSGKVSSWPRIAPGAARAYEVRPMFMYPIGSVRVGDHVAILYSRENGIDTCDHVCIRQRPGGRVPPLPDEAEALLRPPPRPLPAGFTPPRYIPYHERMNAIADAAERRRGLPLAPPPREVNRPGA